LPSFFTALTAAFEARVVLSAGDPLPILAAAGWSFAIATSSVVEGTQHRGSRFLPGNHWNACRMVRYGRRKAQLALDRVGWANRHAAHA
jgi:hypothetical protein